MNKALFVDRDGVINKEKNYVHKISDFEFLPGIFSNLRGFNTLGFLIVIVTNQAGIGRGFYDEEDFNHITEWMLEEFNKNDVDITDVFFDPNHPVHGKGKYQKESFDRKPNPGMILKAAKKYEISLEDSILIGDKWSDIQAGINAGIGKLYLVKTGHFIEKENIPQNCNVVDSIKDVLLQQQ